MAKIALYFFDNQDAPRVLDTDSHPGGKLWKIGRGAGSDISFAHPAISRTHAALRCRNLGIDDLSQWEIMAVGVNPSYRSASGEGDSTLPRNLWVALEDGDRLWFVVRDCGFLITTEIDETLELDTEEDEITEVGPAPAPAPPPERSPEPDTWVSLARVILNGPDGIPDALWWCFLAVVALVVLVLKYG